MEDDSVSDQSPVVDDSESNAVGVLHEEMRIMGSVIMTAADRHKVPAGGALAVILTEHHAFPVKGVEAVIGRATREIPCEVNLALEDPAKATKLSRTAAVLSYDARADTYTIANTGRRPLSVNGREVAIGARCELKSGALLTLAKIPCLFVAHPQAARIAEGRASREDAQRNWPQPGGAYRGHGGRGAW